MVKILVTDGIDPEGLSALKSSPIFEPVYIKDTAQLEKEIGEAEALLVRSKTKATPALLDAGRKLKFVGRAGVGVDNIDIPYASKKGIVVVNVPGGNTISAAEHSFALLLALTRNIPQADRSMRQGEWKRDRFMGAELLGKTLGLLGFGRIGSEVAKKAQAFGMRVSAYDPFVSEAHMKSLGVAPASLENVLAGSDYVSLHLPVTDQTKKIINAAAIAKMKPDARLINCARGELVDEEALVNALKEKKIKGAALDVFSSEPPKNPELLKLENVILTPHLGASTEEAQSKVAVDLAVSLRDFFEKGIIRNAVNMPSVDTETLQKISPYLRLAEKLGRFLSQIVSGGLQEIKIELFGDFSNEMRNLLGLSALQGVLSTAIGAKQVNLVNAAPIAKERGILIKETAISESVDFTSLIRIRVRTDKETKSAAGTLLSHNNPRIVAIDDLSLDVIPEGHLIVFTNLDQPGVVGFIGTILGENRINIAEFEVGRRQAGGEAVSILKVDSPVPDNVVKKIQGFSGITNVWLVDLL